MAPHNLDDDRPDAEEDYHESSDEDFNPTNAPAEEFSSESDEDQPTAKPKQRKGKRKAPADDELDSGDEVTIDAARKRKTKKRKGDKGDDDGDLILSDDGGDGGLIKTRAQRRVEQKERRPLVRTEGATVNVDALWAQMTAAPLKSQQPTKGEEQPKGENAAADGVKAVPAADIEEEQVTVKKIYSFAGQRTSEEKRIPRSSLEKHLSDGWTTAGPSLENPEDVKAKDVEATKPKIRRPLRRPSRFDPNPIGYVRALAPEFQLTWPRKITTAVPAGQENATTEPGTRKARVEKTQKLNVVDKSRLDWTGFVDKEGIADELNTHGKTKEAYLGRMEFLAGVEAKKEEERKRLKTAATS